MKRAFFISFCLLTACTTYGDKGALGGVKSQWRADDKLVVVSQVNFATSISKGGAHVTEMSLYKAANEATERDFDYFCSIVDAEEQIAMELNGELPVIAEKGMAPNPSADRSIYSNTLYIMSKDKNEKCKSSWFDREAVIRNLKEKFES